MNYTECSKAALNFIKQRQLLGSELAEKARTFDNIKGPHAVVLKNEYKSDYNQDWPGCSEKDQWSAVNWENQVYVNSKDPNITSQCQMKRAGALAGLLSHEIFHVKAGSNYCANERNCLFKHELLAHMYERLVQREHDGDPQTKAVLTQADIDELSKQVFRNYIEQSVSTDTAREYNRLHSAFIEDLQKAGADAKHLRLGDVDVMLRIGRESLLKNQFYNGKKKASSHKKSASPATYADTRKSVGDGYRSTSFDVFYNGTPLAGVEPLTFEVLHNGYARDSQHVYFKGGRVHDAVPDRFRVLKGSVATDNRDIFFEGNVLHEHGPVDSVAGSRQRSAARRRIRRLRSQARRRLADLLHH